MSQIGKKRIYTNLDEKTSPDLVTCDICKVVAVPRGITSSRPKSAGVTGERHCPNCGHIHGRADH